jgi:sigma-E factor negative regulatory protein RseC
MDMVEAGPDASGRHVVEGLARVVALDGKMAVLEPEQSSACGGCHAAAVCGTKSGHGRRLMARRFSVANDQRLAVGERVVVGIDEQSLVRASMTAYALPLLTMLGAGMTAQALVGSDGISAAATLGGLAVGLLLARLRAGRLSARGELTPRFLRRSRGPGTGDCHMD